MGKAALGYFLTIIIVFSMIAVIIQVGAAQISGTNVSGVISSNTVWSISNSPYTLTGNIFVNNGITLSISAGVTVYFNDHSIRVNGTLSASGTANNSINFVSLTPTLLSSDGIIDFLSGSINWNEQAQTGCLIQNVIITYNQPVPAIFIDSSSPKINHCSLIDPYPNNYNYGEAIEIISSTNMSASPIITNNTIGNAANIGIYDGGNNGNSLISGNYIYDSRFAIESASNSTIIQNLLKNNNVGVSLDDVWLNNTVMLTNQTNRMVQNNTFIENNEAVGVGAFYNVSGIMYNDFDDNFINLFCGIGSIFSSQGQYINATNNWWGTTDLQAINGLINCPSVIVNYLPILTQINPVAPTTNYDPNPLQKPTTPHSVTINHIGDGTVSPSDGIYNLNSLIILTATPASNSVFMCWLENGIFLSSSNPYNYTPTNDVVITAIFYNPNKNTPPSSYLVTMTHTGIGAISPPDGQQIFSSPITLTANPGTNYAFSCWLQNGTFLSSSNPYVYTPTNNYVITAIFYDPIDKSNPTPTPTPSPSQTPTTTSNPSVTPTSNPNSSPTNTETSSSPHPTPTVPEIQMLATLILLISILLVTTTVKTRKQTN